jgi:putative transposase
MVKNHKLAKSISDAAWSQFAEWLQYFVQVYGKTVIAVGPQYTSQDCSNCGNLVKKTLSTRTHICGCGAILDRDQNAARNILTKGLKQAGINLNTVGHTEINAWGQTDLYLLVATSTSKSTGPTKNPRAFTRPECQSVKLETRMGSASSLYSAIAISSGDIEGRKSLRPDSSL